MNEPTPAPATQTQASEPAPADLALAAAYKTAPAHIKAYLDSGKLADVVLHLQNTYGLHVDVTEKVAKELVLTLVGIVPPTEFPINLRVVAKIQEAYIEPIVNDVNRLIFVPLREQTKTGGMEIPLQAPAEPRGPEWIDVSGTQKPQTTPGTGRQSTPPITQTPPPSYGTPAVPPPAPKYEEVLVNPPPQMPSAPSQTQPAVPAPVQNNPISYAPAGLPAQVPVSNDAPGSPYETFHTQARTMAQDIAEIKQGGSAQGVPSPLPPRYEPQPPRPPVPPSMPQMQKPAGAVPPAPPPRTIPSAYQDVAPAASPVMPSQPPQEVRSYTPPPPTPPLPTTPPAPPSFGTPASVSSLGAQAPRAIPAAYQDVLARPAPSPNGQGGYAPQSAPPHVPGSDPYREPVE